MNERIEFTRNHSDLSTTQGFQFEFLCDRCSIGFRTGFQASLTSTVSGAIEAASSLFGGILGKAADLSERVRSASWEKAHDAAFQRAMEEMRPEFIQCSRCSGWVCRENCWNVQKGLCKNCAPDLGVEMAAAESSRTVQEIWAHSTCPSCGGALAKKVKFCPDCGAKIQVEGVCSGCGAQLAPGAKFCAECGDKVE